MRQTEQRTELFTLKLNDMLEFIYIPVIVGTVTLGIYKLFELFVRKKERLTIIEKMGDRLDPSMLSIDVPFSPSFKKSQNASFMTLRISFLLLGIGLGLLVGFFISQFYNLGDTQTYNQFEIRKTVYGATVLIFGGLSLLIAFLIEMRLNKSDQK